MEKQKQQISSSSLVFATNSLHFLAAARNSEERGLVSDCCSHHTPSLVRSFGNLDFESGQQYRRDDGVICFH